MPHFESGTPPHAYLDVLKLIPENELILLDKNILEYDFKKAVFQDFKADIYHALMDAETLIQKYKSIGLIFPEFSNHPIEIIEGAKQYGRKTKHALKLYANAVGLKPVKGVVYIVISDDDLVILIKKIRKMNFVLGQDVGIISFNESELKDLLDITVISTDFEQMGKTAAEMILHNINEQIKNPFRIIKRGSL